STLLDFIRKANVVAGEAGGITQHVAAYEVEHKSKKITFIDTPGHAAFSTIRARGANVADIAILVVSADDGVKAQTLEALSQIRDAKIPFVVAINKIDKPNADVSNTQRMLLEKEVYLEKLGGDVPWAAISAKTGAGVDELLDLILLVAEMHEFKADASAPAEGYIVETHRDQKRGLAATLIITNGTLKSGAAVLAGTAIAPVRIMENHLGKPIKEATFSTPITLVGFDEMPEVGSTFKSYNKRDAEKARAEFASTQPKKAAVVREEESSERFFLPVVVRADTTGSLEAILQETARLGDEFSRVTIVQSGIGAVSESDVKSALAGSVPGVVIGFNVKTDTMAETLARQNGIRIETFDIIYKLTEKLEELLQTARPKRHIEETVGSAKVLKQFSSRKDEYVVGGKVTSGYLAVKGLVRVIRRGTLVTTGKIRNIQTNKQNADRVSEGSEFGAQIEASAEIAQGDTIECYIAKTE
ncbi:GTP-binding protein, partial [Candidatus Kaiserbacteria bacterium]|nr:GTP-binding protein [Candidatus Kaiserbacteria bacterium]